MRNLGLIGAALLVAVVLFGDANKADAQRYYVSRPIAYGAYPYAYPTYSYYGGWYQGSYMNNYGNYGAYHVMSPVWNGGYRYRYGW